MSSGNTGRVAHSDAQTGAGPPVAIAGLGSVDRADLSALAQVARDAFLDALPIAAAVVAEGDTPGTIISLAYNARYRAIDSGADAANLLIRAGLTNRVIALLAGGRIEAELSWIDGDDVHGRHYAIRIARLTPVAGLSPRCLLTLVDRTSEIETQRSLRAEMLHDSLTGLPNRAAFEEAVEIAATDETHGHALAVVLIDLVRFSRINESMGGVVGDELIITVARRLLGALRASDMLARIGGDEFAILMHGASGEPALIAAADRIQAVLHAPFQLSDLEIRVDCAIGAALARDGAGGTEDVVRNAQLALKRAKDSGHVELYQRGEVAAVRRRFSIETELRRAIEQDRLSLAWQPVVDLQHGGISGFEALARWHHPDQGHISPVEFIPVAEESGLIVPLGRWALDAALRTLKAWDVTLGRTMPITIAVNLSPLQLARDDVPAAIDRALGAHALAGDRLTVELTESAIIRDPERAMRILSELTERAVTIAMDDFGTGYSNLAYLQKLPIDLLKIDRSFVTPMLADRDSVAIVRAVLSLAKSLGMKTTAEGVETMELSQTLAALGCNYGQGYHYARPLAPDDALAYWRAASA